MSATIKPTQTEPENWDGIPGWTVTFMAQYSFFSEKPTQAEAIEDARRQFGVSVRGGEPLFDEKDWPCSIYHFPPLDAEQLVNARK